MNTTEIWTMVTAIATCALALFAVLAWKSAQKQVRQMEEDSAAAEKRFAKQLSADRNNELRNKMEESLFGYLSAHADVIAASTGTGMPIGLAQTQVKKANIRFRMVWALPGLGGELTNFDTIMTMLATTRLDEDGPGSRRPFGNRGVQAETALLHGFQNLSVHVSDLYQKRIDPLGFRKALADDFREILRTNEHLLVAEYVQHMRKRGMFE